MLGPDMRWLGCLSHHVTKPVALGKVWQGEPGKAGGGRCCGVPVSNNCSDIVI